MIFLKSFHYQNLEWHEFMPDDLYMSWNCFRGDKIRAHNIPKYYSKPNTLRKTKQCCLCKWTLTTAIFVHEKSRALQNTITTLLISLILMNNSFSISWISLLYAKTDTIDYNFLLSSKFNLQLREGNSVWVPVDFWEYHPRHLMRAPDGDTSRVGPGTGSDSYMQEPSQSVCHSHQQL